LKRKALNIASGWLLLAAFLFAQLPFSAFHDHDHSPVCELTTQPKKAWGDKAHYHNYEDDTCFVCSGCILKKDYSSVHFAGPAALEAISSLLPQFTEEQASSVSISRVCRGPPSTFLS
jgi:hypothetical protein